MKKTIILSMLALTLLSISATASTSINDGLSGTNHPSDESLMTPLKPTYLDNTFTGKTWDSNWFIEAKGGANAFVGSPVGCGDLFDRITPTLQVGFGKWFTPSIGGRIEYQGLEFKNANLENMKYQFIHADFMYNVTGLLGQNEYGLSRWDLVPFIGVGMIHNSDWKNGCQCEGMMSNSHPFAFSYGIQIGYRLSNRLHLVGEISGMTTAKSFDTVGTSAKFGDNMLNVSAGLSVTLGKVGWKRVIDARPYISQNSYLMDQLNAKRKNCDIENNAGAGNQDKNNYSGLNSLRYRMSLNATPYDSVSGRLDSASTICIGTPVYFYFKIGTTKLVDKSQLANLDELAKLAKEHNLNISIKGAADKATGSKKINRNLSKNRARYIARELIRRGLSKSQMKAYSLGGINEFKPKEANRFSLVVLTE